MHLSYAFFSRNASSLCKYFGRSPPHGIHTGALETIIRKGADFRVTVTVFGRHKQTLLTHLSALIPAAADRGSGQADAILVRGDPCGDILILPERSGGFCRRFPKACIVSCGMSARDSVSCSSFQDRTASIAVMRELPLISGGRLEVQEICLRLQSPLSAELLSMAVAALLCAGVRPEQIVTRPF